MSAAEVEVKRPSQMISAMLEPASRAVVRAMELKYILAFDK